MISDVRQIWDNCAIFNGPTHNITIMAKNLDDSFEKSVERVPRDDVSVRGRTRGRVAGFYRKADAFESDTPAFL